MGVLPSRAFTSCETDRKGGPRSGGLQRIRGIAPGTRPCRWRPGGRPPPYLPSAPRGWNFLPNLLLRKLDDSSELREGPVNSHGPTIRVWPCLLSRDPPPPAFAPSMGHAFLSEWQTSAQSPQTLRGASPAARSGAVSACLLPRAHAQTLVKTRPSPAPRGAVVSTAASDAPTQTLTLAGRRADPGSGLRESDAPFPNARSNIKPDKATANHHSFQMYTFDRATNCKACRMFLR